MITSTFRPLRSTKTSPFSTRYGQRRRSPAYNIYIARCRDTNARPRYLSARRVELRNYKRAPRILRAPYVHSISQLMRAPPNDTDRELLALPARLDGLGIVNPTKLLPSEHQASINISAPLRDLILEQNHDTPLNVSKLKSTPRGMSTNKIVTKQ